MKVSEIRCHDDPPALVINEKKKSSKLYLKPKDNANRFGIFVIRFGCKIAGIDFVG